MAVVLKEQLELRPSVALQKKVGLKSLEQVIRWGDRVNQELRRLRKLEDRKCWRARARRIRKKSREMLNEPGPALKDMRPKEEPKKQGKVNCACAACGDVQQMWWQKTWMV